LRVLEELCRRGIGIEDRRNHTRRDHRGDSVVKVFAVRAVIGSNEFQAGRSRFHHGLIPALAERGADVVGCRAVERRHFRIRQSRAENTDRSRAVKLDGKSRRLQRFTRLDRQDRIISQSRCFRPCAQQAGKVLARVVLGNIQKANPRFPRGGSVSQWSKCRWIYAQRADADSIRRHSGFLPGPARRFRRYDQEIVSTAQTNPFGMHPRRLKHCEVHIQLIGVRLHLVGHAEVERDVCTHGGRQRFEPVIPLLGRQNSRAP